MGLRARHALYSGACTDWRRRGLRGSSPHGRRWACCSELVTLALGARDDVGRTGAAVALALFAFSPNFLAHTRLVTTDVPLTFVVVSATACLWMAWRSRKDRMGGGRLGVRGPVHGHEVLRVLIRARLPGAHAAAVCRNGPWRRSLLARRQCSSVGAVVFTELLVFACYGFSSPSGPRSVRWEWRVAGRDARKRMSGLLRRSPVRDHGQRAVAVGSAFADRNEGHHPLHGGRVIPVYLMGMRGDRGMVVGVLSSPSSSRRRFRFIILVIVAKLSMAIARSSVAATGATCVFSARSRRPGPLRRTSLPTSAWGFAT